MAVFIYLFFIIINTFFFTQLFRIFFFTGASFFNNSPFSTVYDTSHNSMLNMNFDCSVTNLAVLKLKKKKTKQTNKKKQHCPLVRLTAASKRYFSSVVKSVVPIRGGSLALFT